MATLCPPQCARRLESTVGLSPGCAQGAGRGGAAPRPDGSGCGPWRTGAGLPELGAVSSEIKSEPAASHHSILPSQPGVPLGGWPWAGARSGSWTRHAGQPVGTSSEDPTEPSARLCHLRSEAASSGETELQDPEGEGWKRCPIPAIKSALSAWVSRCLEGPLPGSVILGPWPGSGTREEADPRKSPATPHRRALPSCSAVTRSRGSVLRGHLRVCVCVFGGVPCPLSPRLPSAEPAPCTAPGSGWQARPPPSDPGCAGRPGLVPLKATERLQDVRRG